jgi:hypothetical protein
MCIRAKRRCAGKAHPILLPSPRVDGGPGDTDLLGDRIDRLGSALVEGLATVVQFLRVGTDRRAMRRRFRRQRRRWLRSRQCRKQNWRCSSAVQPRTRINVHNCHEQTPKRRTPAAGQQRGSRHVRRRNPRKGQARGRARRGRSKPIAHFCDGSRTIVDQRDAVKKKFLGIFARRFTSPLPAASGTGLSRLSPSCLPRTRPTAQIGGRPGKVTVAATMILIKAPLPDLWPPVTSNRV